MKKILLLLSLSFFITIPTLANNSNWGVPLENQENTPAGEAEEQVFDDEMSQETYENYGSKQSPSYLNDENTNLYEQNYGGDPFDVDD